MGCGASNLGAHQSVTDPQVPSTHGAGKASTADTTSGGAVSRLGDIPGTLQELQQDAKSELDKFLQASKEGDLETLDEQVNSVLAGAETVVASVLSWVEKPTSREVAIQELRLEARSPAEQALARYSALGRVLVSSVSQAVAALPFGAPVAAVLGAVYGRAEQAAKTSGNARRLLQLVQWADTQLAKVAAQGSKRVLSSEAKSGAKELANQLVRAGQLLHNYCGRGFLIRFVVASSDREQFSAIDAGIRDAMQRLALSLALEQAAAGNTGEGYQNESAALRDAVCAAAGEADPEAALQALQSKDPAQLRQLLKEVGSFSDQVVAMELEALEARMVKVELRQSAVELRQDSVEQRQAAVEAAAAVAVSRIEALEAQVAAAAQQGPVALAQFLSDWWAKYIGRLKTTVGALDFMRKLAESCQDAEVPLSDYEAELDMEGLKAALLAQSKSSEQSEAARYVFLYYVFLPLLDADADGVVSRSEMYRLQLVADTFAVRHVLERPLRDWRQLLDSIYVGFDRDQLRASISSHLPSGSTDSEREALQEVVDGLQVTDVIRSYNVAAMLDEYLPGSREWLYEDVAEWLDHALAAAVKDDKPLMDSGPSRMYVLLGDAGMGKSVFSAVMEGQLVVERHRSKNVVMARHFFKVGQVRAQAKVALLCLAQQLAEQLPGMAPLLAKVIKKHGRGEELSMAEVFDKFLKQPLEGLDASVGSSHVVVLLLDALDEAADGPQGWEGVAALVGHEFQALPPWVYLIVTSRPQAREALSKWMPRWIQPQAADNLKDLRRLAASRLTREGQVCEADLEAAADMIVEKSEGQLIYIKYAFDELAKRPGLWSLQQLQQLPPGLHGVFTYVLDTVQEALGAERPDLLDLLSGRLLPVLLAARETLSPPQLAWATGSKQEEVSQLLRLLATLFPCRPCALPDGQPRVVPYHKSVLDWLGLQGHAHSVNEGQGHWLMGSACSKLFTLHPPLVQTHQPEAGSRHAYALRHTVAHLCLAHSAHGPQALPPLEGALLCVGGWERVFAAGAGPDVTRDLAALGPVKLHGSVSHDVLRWLKHCGGILQRHPRAALQMACDAPTSSRMAAHAAQLPYRPDATCLSKEDSWPPLLATVWGHSGSVTCVAFSSCGGFFVSGSRDTSLRVWDTESGAFKTALQGHAEPVSSVAVSSDSSIIVSGSMDKTVRVWAVKSGECRSILQGHFEPVTSVAISADTSLIVSASLDTTLRLWDGETGACRGTLSGHSGAVASVFISPDSTFIVSGSADKTIRLWDPQSSQCVSTLQGHTETVACVAVSSNNTMIVSGSNDITVRVWDVQSRGCTAVLRGHSEAVTSVALTADSKTIVSGSADKAVRVWAAASGECRAILRGHLDVVRCLALSPDGSTAVSGSGDKTMRVWELDSSNSRSSNSCSGSTLHVPSACVTSTAVSDNDRIVVAGYDDSIARVWSMETGKCISKLIGHSDVIRAVAVSADGRTVVTGSDDHALRVWDAQSGECRGTLKGHSRAVRCVTATPDGTTVVSGSDDYTVRVWDIRSGVCTKVLEGHTRTITSVAASPDGTSVVSSSRDNTVRSWDMASGTCKEVLSGPDAAAKAVSVQAWPSSSSRTNTSADVSVQSDGEEVRVKGRNGGAHTTIYVPPPYRVNSTQCIATKDSHTLGAFCQTSGTFLLFHTKP